MPRSTPELRPSGATVVEATFAPKNRDDIHPMARSALDKRLTWVSQGLVVTGIYAGQQAWMPVGLDQWPGWVPSADLDGVEVVI